MKSLGKVSSGFDRTLSGAGVLAILLIVFIILAVCTEIIMRYFLGRSQVWVIEISEYCLLFMTFLGGAWVLKKEAHVRMDLVLSRLKPRTQALLNAVTSVVCAAAFLVVIWYGVERTLDHFQLGYFISSALNPPSFVSLAVIPIGSFLLFIQFLRRAYGYMRSWRRPQDNRDQDLDQRLKI